MLYTRREDFFWKFDKNDAIKPPKIPPGYDDDYNDDDDDYPDDDDDYYDDDDEYYDDLISMPQYLFRTVD